MSPVFKAFLSPLYLVTKLPGLPWFKGVSVWQAKRNSAVSIFALIWLVLGMAFVNLFGSLPPIGTLTYLTFGSVFLLFHVTFSEKRLLDLVREIEHSSARERNAAIAIGAAYYATVLVLALRSLALE